MRHCSEVFIQNTFFTKLIRINIIGSPLSSSSSARSSFFWMLTLKTFSFARVLPQLKIWQGAHNMIHNWISRSALWYNFDFNSEKQKRLFSFDFTSFFFFLWYKEHQRMSSVTFLKSDLWWNIARSTTDPRVILSKYFPKRVYALFGANFSQSESTFTHKESFCVNFK